jgi:hypothetical protein
MDSTGARIVAAPLHGRAIQWTLGKGSFAKLARFDTARGEQSCDI